VRDRAWTRADGSRLPVDVRVMASTSRSLEAAVASGAFRRDLWGLLEAQTILIAPLRERREDLPILTDLFVEQVARKHVRAVNHVSTKALDMLLNYEWPGNVAELRRTIERAVVLTTGPIIHHHHLPAEIQQSGEAGGTSLGLTEALDAYEKELLQEALRQAHGVRSRAARLLMTSERVLSYRLRKHRIDSRRFKAS
jgi:Nif-specific regulatory protein